MRFSLITALVASAALSQVGASPVRVVVVTAATTTTDTDLTPFNPNLRFGYTVDKARFNPHAATVVPPAGPGGRTHRPCRMRLKAIKISNAFRKVLGLPLIHTDVAKPNTPTSDGDGMYHILPFVGTPPTVVKVDSSNPVSILPHPHPHHHHHHHDGGFRHRMAKSPFMERLHVALTALGPWEGRAVAFVLGCGIGVLLRMLWVLSVVMYRTLKGTKEDENKYTQIIVVEEYDDEVAPPVAAPPTYTYEDAKVDVKIAEETK
jgi:hypothetical protein